MAMYLVYALVFLGIIVWKDGTFENIFVDFFSKRHEEIASQNITASL